MKDRDSPKIRNTGVIPPHCSFRTLTTKVKDCIADNRWTGVVIFFIERRLSPKEGGANGNPQQQTVVQN